MTFHEIDLKLRPDKIIYTDGSRQKTPHIGLVTGSGVYREHKHAHLSLKVHQYEQGMLNVINMPGGPRAKLVTLLIARTACIRDMEESLRRYLHDKHQAG